MALSMHTNYASLVTQNTLNSTNNLLNTAMERLSTGMRINSAADDAAGLQIANRLEAQNRGMKVAMRNSQDSISMLQTAEGAMEEMTNISYRMKDLATQAANGSNTQADRDALQAEFTQLSAELSNIYENSNFGGRSLFAGSANDSLANSNITFQIGASKAETLQLDVQSFAKSIGQTLEANTLASDAQADFDDALQEAFEQATATAPATPGGTFTWRGKHDTADRTSAATPDLSAPRYTDLNDLKSRAEGGDTVAQGHLTALETVADTLVTASVRANYNKVSNYGTDLTNATRASLKTASVSIAEQTDARNSIDKVKTLIDKIGASRAQFGANINRLEHTIANLGNMSENVSASKGRITDADFAVESSNMTKNQMLMQAGTTVLSQTNQLPGMAMSLLR